jgi:hypothetical protein
MMITLGALVSSRAALQNLFAQPLPAKSSFQLQKTLKVVNLNLEVFETTLKSLCERYGTTEDGTTYKFAPENQIAMQKETDDLQGAEVELPDYKISQWELDGVKLSVLDMASLEWLIED